MKNVIIVLALLLSLLFIYILSNKAPSKNSISASLRSWELTQKEFKYGGYKLSYKDSMDGSQVNSDQKEVVLLLHGYPTSSFDWHLVWEELSKDYRLIAMDMLGYGFSDKPNDVKYSISLQTDIQQALLSELGINQIHLLTHDYGDNVAQELLARLKHSNELNVKSWVLLNGGLFPDVYKGTTIQSLLRSPVGPLISKLSNEAIFKKSFDKVFSSGGKLTKKQITDHWYLISYNNGNNINHLLTHAADDRKRNRERWFGALITEGLPILFINGLDDPVSGKETVKKYELSVPNHNIIKLEGVGHYPHLETPDIVIEEFKEFAK